MPHLHQISTWPGSPPTLGTPSWGSSLPWRMTRECSPLETRVPSCPLGDTILAGGRTDFNPHATPNATATMIYSLHAPGEILKKILAPQWVRRLRRGERSQPLPKSPWKYRKALLKTYQLQQATRTSNPTLLSNCPCLLQYACWLLREEKCRWMLGLAGFGVRFCFF